MDDGSIPYGSHDDASNGVDDNLKNAAQSGGVVPLGFQGMLIAVWSVLRECVVWLAPRDLTASTVLAVCGEDWALRHFPKMDGKTANVVVDMPRLKRYIVDECEAAGPFKVGRERPAGVWPEEDGLLVVNSKDGVWRSDGVRVERYMHGGFVYLAAESYDLAPETPCASREEVAQLMSLLGSWTWKHESEKALVMGWLATAALPAALKRRPHLGLTGRRGTGKTLLRGVIACLLGENCISIDGDSTVAGIRQRLGGSPLAVLVDEVEGHANAKKLSLLIAQARSSYSDDGEGVLRGTVGGKAANFSLLSPFMYCGVNPPAFEPSDSTRWVVAEMVELGVHAKRTPHPFVVNEDYCRDVGRRLRRLVVARYPVLKASLEVIHRVIVAHTGNPRMADTLGTLLAGYWCLVSENVASEADAEALFASLNLSAHAEQHSAQDEADCLETVLTSLAKFTSADRYGAISRVEMPIGQALRKVCLGDKVSDTVHAELQNMGLRVMRRNGTWHLGVVSSPHHQGVRRLFSGTRWADGGWSKQLLRIEGAQRDQQRIGSIGSRKMVVIPVPAELLVAELSPRNLANDASDEDDEAGAVAVI